MNEANSVGSFPTTLKDLAPADARLALSIHRFVTRELGVDWRGAGLVVALSAGLDSTALLLILSALRQRLNFSLTAAHLDHGLRAESGQDAEAARELCRRLEVPFRLRRCEVAVRSVRTGLEDAGRRARYAFLEQVRQDVGAHWIVTAHHVGDLAEDVLLRLTRGASWPGLGGMPGVGGPCGLLGADGKGRVLRPLLLVEKARLRALLERQGLPWREDASNEERDFRRNRMRLDVLPLLLAENPDLYDVTRSLWRVARMDEEYWREMVFSVPEFRPEGVFLRRAALAALPRPGRLRAYVEAVRRLGKGQVRSSALFALDDAWEQRRHGRVFQFPGGVRAELDARGVLFCSDDTRDKALRCGLKRRNGAKQSAGFGERGKTD